jgi:uncharacterized protein (TIGR03437 family)
MSLASQLFVTTLALTAACAASAATPFNCRRVDRPVTVRAEGSSELLADIVLSCTGGSPAAAGSPVPEYQFVLVANTSLPSRSPQAAIGDWSLSDALLLIDEPEAASQLACVPDAKAYSCPQYSGDASPSNVFQGRVLQGNGIVFPRIPIDAPGDGSARTIRIANLRASPSDLPAKALPSITTTLLIYDANGKTIPVSYAEKVSGQALPASKFTPLTAASERVPVSQPPLILTPSLVPKTNPNPDFGFLLKFTEGFATSFRRRNVATSGGDPLFVMPQDTPGYLYSTESGFYNDSFPAENGMNLTGLAETGTRLRVVFDHIPTGVQLWASVRDVLGTTGYDATAPKAMLTYTSDATYGGPFSEMNAWVPGYAQLFPDGSKASATWEIVAADPTLVESLVFSIALTAQGGSVVTGTANMTATIAPLAIARTDGTLPLPSFILPLATITAKTTTTGAATTIATTAVPAFSIVNSIPNKKTGMYSAASGEITVAPGSLAAVTVVGLKATAAISAVSVVMVDSIGTQRTCQVISISLQQAICLVDPAIKPGLAVVSVTSGGRPSGTGFVQVAQVAPGLFSVDATGQGFSAGNAISQVGAVTLNAPLAVLDPITNSWIAQPVDLSAAPDVVTLELRATGFRGRNANGFVIAQIAGVDVPVISITPSVADVGVDLVQIGPLPQSLAGAGLVDVQLAVDGVSANPVQIYLGQSVLQPHAPVPPATQPQPAFRGHDHRGAVVRTSPRRP